MTFSSDFDDLLPFTYVSAYSVLGVVEQLGGWFDQARQTAVFDVLLPLVGDSRIGDRVRLGDAILDPDTGLIGQLRDANQQPTFRSVQEFAVDLRAVLGLSESQLNAAYDANSRELTFRLRIDHTFADLSDPNNDGKVHLDEFLGNLQLGLLSTFDVSGAVTAKLDAYVELLLVRHEFRLAEFTIIDFELTDSDIYVDRFTSGASSGASAAGAAASGPVCSSSTQLGIGPGLHVDGLSLETHGAVKCYEFELLRTDSVDVDVRHSYARGDIDLEVYDADGNLLGASRVPDVDPSLPQTFYVNDRSQASDQYTTAIGNNRNTGTTADDPKEVIRPLVLSYPLGVGDVVLVDTGDYVHAVNLSGSFQATDPRMNPVSQTQILGPVGSGTARIDRANPYPDAKTIDIIGSQEMVLKGLTLVDAYTGLHVRDASHDFAGERLTIEAHTADGLDIEGHSDGATLDELTVRDNGGHGIFVESRLNRITHSAVYGNGAIGIALRDVGAALVETSRVYDNQTGIDILNPGLQQAVIGRADLDQQRGNLVYQNATDGIYASGKVLVAGNTVAENGSIGIHLNDGADAWRNVVRQHINGTWALGSESDIIENRSYANTDTGIAASFASRVQGPGAGASLINNTVYEPCVDNRFEPPPGQTVIEIPWQWHVLIERFPDPISGHPGGAFPVLLSGLAQIRFGEPVGELSGETFDLGPGGSSRSETAEPVPPGQRWTIPIEIVALDLRSDPVPGLGEVWAMLQPSQPSAGSLSLEAVAMGLPVGSEPDELALIGNSSLELHLDSVLPNEGQWLFSVQPMLVGADFDLSAGLGSYDALRMAVPILAKPGTLPVGLVSPLDPDDLWGQWFMEAGLEDTPPQDKGQYCASVGIHVLNDSHYVLMRNNAVFVERGQDPAMHDLAHVVIVEADSTVGWDSDFNSLSTRYGATGKWAGASQWTLTDWQNASRDDYRSIDDDPDLVWVDPDGDDDRLGFAGTGLADGRDDNLHLRSRYGHVLTGALTPVEQINANQPGLPQMQTVAWGTDLSQLSPAIDWGDPGDDFSHEPAENGQIVNLGAYGNTEQASLSEPDYIHAVYPLGREELVSGRSYLIQWRSRLPAMPGVHLDIELRRGNKDGTLQWAIADGVVDTGSYLWTVPAAGIPRADDYMIVVRWPGDPADPNDDVVGQSRRQLTVDADGAAPGDTRPPTVRDVTPRIVHHSRSTNDNGLDRLDLEFSESLGSAAAADPISYELIKAGPDGQFDTADDVVVALTATYTAGATGGDPSQVVLDLSGPLQPGNYRLTIHCSA